MSEEMRILNAIKPASIISFVANIRSVANILPLHRFMYNYLSSSLRY